MAIRSTDTLIDRWAAELVRDEHVTSEFQTAGTALSAYRTVAPAMVRNVHWTADFPMEETRALPAVDVDQVEETTPSFSDFVKLGAAVRGFLDALVQATYQLATFDGLQLNYKFLTPWSAVAGLETKNGGQLETAAAMANHSSTRTTQLYDRRSDQISLEEIERVRIRGHPD